MKTEQLTVVTPIKNTASTC